MMTHGIIGKNLRELRKARGMTQGRLAEQVGVTTQAVSKWESGSTPDAELLPAIASALGVSIDTLYGLSDEVKQDPVQWMAHTVSAAGEEERMDLAVRCAMAAAVGVAGSESLNALVPSVTGGVREREGIGHMIRLLGPRGVAVGNLTQGQQYLFLASGGEEGYDGRLPDRDQCRAFFSLLAREDVMKILWFFLHRPGEAAVLLEVIARDTKLAPAEARRCLEELRERRLAACRSVEGERGTLTAWYLLPNLRLLSLLMLLRDLENDGALMISLDLTEKDPRPFLRK